MFAGYRRKWAIGTLSESKLCGCRVAKRVKTPTHHHVGGFVNHFMWPCNLHSVEYINGAYWFLKLTVAMRELNYSISRMCFHLMNHSFFYVSLQLENTQNQNVFVKTKRMSRNELAFVRIHREYKVFSVKNSSKTNWMCRKEGSGIVLLPFGIRMYFKLQYLLFSHRCISVGPPPHLWLNMPFRMCALSPFAFLSLHVYTALQHRIHKRWVSTKPSRWSKMFQTNYSHFSCVLCCGEQRPIPIFFFSAPRFFQHQKVNHTHNNL